MKDWSLRVKLTVAFLAMIGMVLGVGTVAALNQIHARKAVSEMLDKDVRIAELALRSNAAMLSAWRYEREFLARDKSLTFAEAKARYVALVRRLEGEVHEQMAAIRGLTRSKAITDQTALIDPAVGLCGQSFLEMVNLFTQRLDPERGLLKRLRDRRAAISDALSRTGVEALEGDGTILGSNEQAYLLRGLDSEIAAVREGMTRMKANAARANLASSETQALQSLGDQYLACFDELLRLDSRIGVLQEDYLALRHAVEPLFDQLHSSVTEAEKATRQSVNRMARAGLWATAGTVSAAAVLAVLVAYFMSQTITSGVDRCLGFTRRVAAGELNARLPETSHDEFGTLAAGLNQMTARLEEAAGGLRRANDELESRVQERTLDLGRKNEELRAEIDQRKRAEAELESIHKTLIETSRRAGMAEVATGVLHNVGNVLNSVNVASACMADRLRKSKAASLSKVVAMLREHTADLGEFLVNDPKGKQLPGYLTQLSEHLATERAVALEELSQLQKNIEHIKDIVTMQQSFAKVSGVGETLQAGELVEDALRMNASSLSRHDVQVIKEFDDIPPITTERHKVLQILVNLIRNAKHACDDSGRTEKRLIIRVTRAGVRPSSGAAGTEARQGRANSETLKGSGITAPEDGRTPTPLPDCIQISVSDNGVGIPPENLTRIFAHGFTTKKDGHGFGLHSGALAAKELGGELRVHSDGPGKGATFTLELPFAPAQIQPLQAAVQLAA